MAIFSKILRVLCAILLYLVVISVKVNKIRFSGLLVLILHLQIQFEI